MPETTQKTSEGSTAGGSSLRLMKLKKVPSLGVGAMTKANTFSGAASEPQQTPPHKGEDRTRELQKVPSLGVGAMTKANTFSGAASAAYDLRERSDSLDSAASAGSGYSTDSSRSDSDSDSKASGLSVGSNPDTNLGLSSSLDSALSLSRQRASTHPQSSRPPSLELPASLSQSAPASKVVSPVSAGQGNGRKESDDLAGGNAAEMRPGQSLGDASPVSAGWKEEKKTEVQGVAVSVSTEPQAKSKKQLKRERRAQTQKHSPATAAQMGQHPAKKAKQQAKKEEQEYEFHPETDEVISFCCLGHVTSKLFTGEAFYSVAAKVQRAGVRQWVFVLAKHEDFSRQMSPTEVEALAQSKIDEWHRATDEFVAKAKSELGLDITVLSYKEYREAISADGEYDARFEKYRGRYAYARQWADTLRTNDMSYKKALRDDAERFQNSERRKEAIDGAHAQRADAFKLPVSEAAASVTEKFFDSKRAEDHAHEEAAEYLAIFPRKGESRQGILYYEHGINSSMHHLMLLALNSTKLDMGYEREKGRSHIHIYNPEQLIKYEVNDMNGAQAAIRGAHTPYNDRQHQHSNGVSGAAAAASVVTWGAHSGAAAAAQSPAGLPRNSAIAAAANNSIDQLHQSATTSSGVSLSHQGMAAAAAFPPVRSNGAASAQSLETSGGGAGSPDGSPNNSPRTEAAGAASSAGQASKAAIPAAAAISTATSRRGNPALDKVSVAALAARYATRLARRENDNAQSRGEYMYGVAKAVANDLANEGVDEQGIERALDGIANDPIPSMSR